MRRCILILAILVLSGCSAQQKLLRSPDSPQDEWVNPYVKDEIFVSDFSIDMKTGEIKYTLPEKALVRLRIGMREGGPMLRTLLDWEPREAGPHIEVWDRKDAEGSVDYTGDPQLMVTLQCVKADAPDQESSDFRRRFKRSPDFTVQFPEGQPSSEGLVIKGKTPLRIELSESDRVWLKQTRYEIGLYADGVFIIEDEEASDPFTYRMDTAKFNNGKHVITVNVVAYTGEIGVKNISVMVEN